MALRVKLKTVIAQSAFSYVWTFLHRYLRSGAHLRQAKTATGSVGSWSEQSLAASSLQAFAAQEARQIGADGKTRVLMQGGGTAAIHKVAWPCGRYIDMDACLRVFHQKGGNVVLT